MSNDYFLDSDMEMPQVPKDPHPPKKKHELEKALRDPKHPYYKLALVLNSAFNQASEGKGKERHANDLPFQDQKIQKISEGLQSVDGLLYQVCKKAMESKGLPYPRNVDELLGVIVYASAAIIFNDNKRLKELKND